MRRLLPLVLLFAGCVTPAGQRVTVLLNDITVPCETSEDPEAPARALLQLDQEDDFYQVQLLEASSGLVRTLPAERTGTTVRFLCPTGFDELVVRHATILQSRVEQPSTGAPAAP